MYRIIVADDEMIECRALEMMLRNDFPELEVVPSVYNGTDLIAGIEKYQPDIAIVDINMPQLNGLDALELIRTRNQQLKIIISSAYSDFEYVKRAMKLGASDYILKPLEKDAFEETLTKVIGALQKEQKKASWEQENQEHLGEMTHAVGTEFLSSLMLGEPDEKSFAIYQCSMNREYNGGVLVCVRRAGTGAGEKRRYDRKKEDTFLETVLAGMNQYSSCVGKWNKGELYFLMMAGSQISGSDMCRWTEDIAGMLQAMLEQHGQGQFIIGVSTWKYDGKEMAAGLTESRIAARAQNTPGLYYYEVPRKNREQSGFEGLEGRCRQWIRDGRIDECLAAIHEVFEQMEEPGAAELTRLQTDVLEFILPLYEDIESGQDYLTRYSKDTKVTFSALSECKSREELEHWCRECLTRFSMKAKSGEKKSREYIERTLMFMEEHYMEDISLEDVADNSGISSFYLSRLLKQELKQTFVEILTDIRMRQALNLLWDENKTVKEIAEKSGYSNITYFYKVFKKYTGMNIGEIRDQMK